MFGVVVDIPPLLYIAEKKTMYIYIYKLYMLNIYIYILGIGFFEGQCIFNEKKITSVSRS